MPSSSYTLTFTDDIVHWIQHSDDINKDMNFLFECHSLLYNSLAVIIHLSFFVIVAIFYIL